jgi:hypothetical protein
MWLLLSSRLRRWLLFAVALPAGRFVIHRVATRAAQRNTNRRTSRLARQTDDALARTRRRPV